MSGGVAQKTVTGNFAGLIAFCQKYIITSTARKNNTNARATVVYDLEDQLIPLFQFGIFYQNRLEINPGADMSFTGGRIHSNTAINMRPYSGKTLSVDSIITSAGDIINQRADYTETSTSTVRIKNAAGVYQTLDIDSVNDPSWKSDALEHWDGRVKSSAHSIQPLNLPLPAGGEPIDILGTGTTSLYGKSGLRIINGVAKDKNGATVDLALGGNNPISTKTFYDGREGKTMTVVELDINLLKDNTVAIAKLNDPPAGGESGILYTSSNNITNPAVRLVNGGTLPAGGLSVVTDNPLYVKGHYNTANGPAGIFADAVTILSGSWSDANSALGIGNRVASNTTVKAAIMAGNKDTVGSQYSGGAENFMRYLENWSGKTYTYGGSLTCLWQSVQATGNWPGTGTVYNAPIRSWSYGIDMNNMPPGTPRVRNLQLTSLRQVID